MLSDIVISKRARKEPIEKIAGRLGIDKKYLTCYGKYIAKIEPDILTKIKSRPQGKYILVTAITPTPLGEGKTVNSIGLSMALNRLKKLSAVCIRQPSLGPVFGIKGSAGGGGYAQVLPRGDFDLHFTGDAHAVGLAHNIAAAFLDNSLFRGNKLNIDLNKIYWPRVVDIGDRSLRRLRIGLGAIPRESRFDITAASEIMAILALSSDLQDLKKRLSKIVLAQDKRGRPITTKDIKVAGLMAVLLKDAIRPNLIQTIENTPCFVHAGPFANIAHGNSSIIQDRIALGLCDYVVTEAGFGAECGAEKFFDIKCRVGGFKPDAAVLVVSVRGLKAHSARFNIIPGKPLDKAFNREDIAVIKEGLPNLAKQIENVKRFGIPVVVAINRFASDTDREIDFIREKAENLGADDCQVSEVWLRGSKGGLDLAKSVMRLAARPKKFRFLYPLDIPLTEKIDIIATQMYGAKRVVYSRFARDKIKFYTRQGWAKLPVCMAKTPLSLSHDPRAKGRPSGFVLPVRDIRAYLGAGFLAPLCGTIQTMPGLPSHPRGENIDIDEKGNIIGLS